MKRFWPVLSIVVVALGVVADILRPPAPVVPSLEQVRPTSTVLSCPVVTDQRGTGSVQVATDEPTSVRVTFLPRSKGKSATIRAALTPGRPRSFKVPSSVKGDASAIVRASSGTVVASHVTRFRSSRSLSAGTGSAECVGAGPTVVAVPHLRTLNARSVLGVFNPGSESAEVTITLSADGELDAPVSLSNLLIPAGRRLDLNVGDFAFDAKDLTAVVRSSIGRVVVEGLVRSSRGAAIVTGVTPGRRTLTASGRSGKDARYSITLVGDEDADLDATFITSTEQGRASRLPASLAPGGGTRIAIPKRNGGAAAAYVTDLSIGSPVVAGASWLRTRRGRSDTSILGSQVSALRWLGVTTGLAKGRVRAIVVNASDATARISPRVNGAAQVDVDIEPGKLKLITIGRGAGVFSFGLRSDAPVSVFLESWGPLGRGIRAWGLGASPLDATPGVSVERVPEIGIPAA